MTRVCLIIPPSAFLLDERVFVSLGILKVAAALEARGYPVEVLDLSGVQNYGAAVATHVHAWRRVDEQAPPVYAITATTPQMPAVAVIVKAIQQAWDADLGGPVALKVHPRLVLGGPHPTLIAAAAKIEAKRGGQLDTLRAAKAMEQLRAMFDTVVAGDGEDAIEQAIRPGAPRLIDADDPKGTLFLSKRRLAELPMPARHLVDMASYHYTVDGEPATSLIAQLGCLAPGTMIRMANGDDKPIEQIKVGDRLLCWDEQAKCFDTGPVVATWARTADDLYRLRLSSCATMLVTGEHPIWTPAGWKRVTDLETGESIGCVPTLREAFASQDSKVLQHRVPEAQDSASVSGVQEAVRTDPGVCAPSELLLAPMPACMAEDARQRDLVARGPACSESPLGWDDASRETGQFEHRQVASEYCDAARSEVAGRHQAWRSQPNETARGRREGVGDAETRLGSGVLGSHAGHLAQREAGAAPAWAQRAVAEQSGSSTGDAIGDGGASLSVRGQRCLLDRTMRIRETAEPGLHRQSSQARDPVARQALAHRRDHAGGSIGLREPRLEDLDHLGRRVATQGSHEAVVQDRRIHYHAVMSKVLVGAGDVHNVTVCPGHSYVANGIVVHNCPFGCSFCGGRASPMLRRARTRPTELVVAEIEHLYRTYGYKGYMLYDDELNVNPKLVELMQAIAALQVRLGVPGQFRLRGFVKAELFTAEQAAAMYAAGFRMLLCGFEAGHPRILENIQKKATVEDNDRVVALAHAAGIKVKALMSIGHAGESAETVEATKQWLLRVRPDDFDCTIITPYPGSPYYDEATKAVVVNRSDKARRDENVWTYTAPGTGDRLHAFELDYMQTADFYKGAPDGGYRSYVFTDHLSPADLVRLRDDLERDVRAALGIPFNPGAPGIQFEASMGQLPSNILRAVRPANGRRA